MLIGTPHHRGTTLLIEGIDAPGAGLATIEVDDVQRFNEFAIQSSAGVMSVFSSLDGITLTSPLAMEDKQSLTPLVRVTVTVAPGIFYFTGNFKFLRIFQATGAGIADARLLCGKIGRAQD